jgi:TolB-like protein/tetratricopeptide (TPR) repeat protein
LLGILAALEALHRRDIVHRDLKPTNVFLTAHGVKLLDFGLARPLAAGAGANLELTVPGALVGSPRYMAPEQWGGQTAGPAADVFAAGVLLFEMLAGRPAFTGRTLLEIMRAIAEEQPPALTGGPAVMAADRIIQRALMKRPAERYPSAAAMAQDVRAAFQGADAPAQVQTTTRLAVLPFRFLRPDPEIDFLSSSLPEAITASLAGIDRLVVRSSLATARTGDIPDLRRVMADADVDVAVTGTLLRSGDQVRVAAQLVEAPAGTLAWSTTIQASIQDIFQLQDQLSREIVDSLAIPLASRGHAPLQQDVPASPRAYELFLRANHIGVSTINQTSLITVRDLYRACVDLDPQYAPAWAQLGRTYRVLAKYFRVDVAENRQRAQQAFERAFALNPDLPLAHNLYTFLEIELGEPEAAMKRLLAQAKLRPNDAQLFAGLVAACRFCGLLDASVEADRRARRLDPNLRTSVQYTFFLRGDYEEAIARDEDELKSIAVFSLLNLGRVEEAKAGLAAMEIVQTEGFEPELVRMLHAIIARDRAAANVALERAAEQDFPDPEGVYMFARAMAYAGAVEEAVPVLAAVVARGFVCYEGFLRDPWLDPLRSNAGFVHILRRAEFKAKAAAEIFRAAGGEQILGGASLGS